MEILNLRDVSKILKKNVKTLQRWDREGRLIAFRTAGTNRRFYTMEQINDFIGLSDKVETKKIIYARVSNSSQKDDLGNQIEFLKQYSNAKGYIIDHTFSDVGSGLNFKRKNWNILLDMVQEREINTIIVAHEDRFVRFGFEWFEKLCRKFGCKIEVVNNEKLSPQEEITRDLISIIHVFSCRVYGLRKYKKEIKNEKSL